jgi:hypothetical protein
MAIRSLKDELGRLLDCVHVSRKVQVVENEDGLDRIRGGDARVFNHDEVIAVSFFSAFGEVRAAGEYFSGGQVEISDHELVVFVNAGARTEFRGERRSDALLEIIPTKLGPRCRLVS